MRFGLAISLLGACALLAGCSDNGPTGPTYFTVSGVVRDGGGTPVPGAEVEASSEGAIQGSLALVAFGETDSAGAFHFGQLPAGRYVVSAFSGSTSAAVRIVVPATASVPLTLAPGGRLTGVARFLARTRHDGIGVTCSAGALLFAFTDSSRV